MASANRYPGIDPKIVRCVRHHAERVRAADASIEIEDAEQELMLHLHGRLSRFDARRGSLRTFVDRVAANCAINLMRATLAEKRGARVEVLSFDAIVRHAGTDGSDPDAVGAETGPMLTIGYAPEDFLNLRIELWRVYDKLPSALRGCFLGLLDGSVVDAARQLGIARSTVYRRIAALREHFQAVDLRLHLAAPDTFSVFPVREQ